MPEQATAEPLVEAKEIESAEAFERRIAERGFVSELTRFSEMALPAKFLGLSLKHLIQTFSRNTSLSFGASTLKRNGTYGGKQAQKRIKMNSTLTW